VERAPAYVAYFVVGQIDMPQRRYVHERGFVDELQFVFIESERRQRSQISNRSADIRRVGQLVADQRQFEKRRQTGESSEMHPSEAAIGEIQQE